MSYIEPVFHPPCEWQSLIIQAANGYAWNRCTFCMSHLKNAMQTPGLTHLRPERQRAL